MTPLRNLLVIATNHLVKNGYIHLDSANDEGEPKGHTFTEIGGKRAVIIWQGITCEEIRISVWWDYNHDKHPQANRTGLYKETFQTSRPIAKSQHYPKFVGAMVSGWLERKTNKHLQGSGDKNLFDKYVRRTSKAHLEAIPKAKAIGFDDSGKYFC